MKMIPTYVLDNDEWRAVHRVKFLVGYELPDGPEREAEQAAVGFLTRRNDPMSGERYVAGYEALKALHARLLESANDPDRWQGVASFMTEQRAHQAEMVAEALEALPDPATAMLVVSG